MKKLYLILCGAMLCISAQARELTFWYGDTPIADGSTINFTDIEVIDNGTYKEVHMEPELYLSTDIFSSEITVTATCTSGQVIELCAGGSCTAGTSVTKENVVISTNEKKELRYDYKADLDIDEEVPTVIATIEAQDGTFTQTRKSFTIVMGESAAINSIESLSDFRFTDAGLEYDLDSASTFALYAVDGRLAMKATLSGRGTLSTSSLAKGIYIYSIGGTSGKIYIK